MHRITWDTTDFKGRNVRLRIVDSNTGGWGHVTFDDFSCEGRLQQE